jgi:hypothetical protein
MSLSDVPATLHAHVLSTVFEISRWSVSCDFFFEGSRTVLLFVTGTLTSHADGKANERWGSVNEGEFID